MTKAVKWGVLGNAMISRRCVMPAINKSVNGVLHALATRSPEHAGKVARENSIAYIYDSYDALLMDPEIDAVYIPLPNHLHRLWALNALNAGKHVLCEKPLACNAKEAREMVSAARGTGR